MYNANGLEERWIEHFEEFIKYELAEIDIEYGSFEDEEIIQYRHKRLREIYNINPLLQRRWLKREYPKIKKWQIERFPLDWMSAEKSPKIAQAIESCPSFLPIVNYLFNYNRYWHGTCKEERKKMKALADKITGGKRHKGRGGNYVFATFITGQAFYREISKVTGCSKNTIQRYLKAFAKIGCLKELDKGKGGKGVLYADGYYVPAPDNKFRKISFLTNSPEIRTGLKKLPQLINEYQIRIKRLERYA